VERRQSEEEPTTMARSVTPTELTPPATPPLDNDLKAILEPFFVELSSFKGDNIGLRKAIQAFGCNLQWQDNKLSAQAKRGNEQDLTALKAINSHRRFLDRYCCPPQKSCIQGFLALAKKVDEECPQADIFQLMKHGGSKGTGNMLVPIIPTTRTQPKYYNDQAKQWLPRVLEATIAGDGSDRHLACFLLCKALERLEPKAIDDAWRTSKRNTGKMDIHRQLAMVDRANLTYSQLRVIRPFLIADKVNPLHSEHEVRKHELHSSHKPVFIDFKEDQYKRHGWYLPVNKVIKDTLEQERGTTQSLTEAELHVILSADHGQGHWLESQYCMCFN
jgi:hypothetical protein